jgi:hypothetical protein
VLVTSKIAFPKEGDLCGLDSPYGHPEYQYSDI